MVLMAMRPQGFSPSSVAVAEAASIHGIWPRSTGSSTSIFDPIFARTRCDLDRTITVTRYAPHRGQACW